jgi:hypothetical protein
MGGYTNVLNLYLRKLFIYYVNNTFSRHRLRLVGRTDGGLHPAFYSSPNGDIVEHRICEITRDSGYPPPATSQILRPLGASGRECEGKIVNLNVEPDF